MATPHSVAVIVGSLRKEAFSLRIANALARLAPPSLKLDVVTLHGISFFNQDLEANPPADWVAFRDKIKAAGAVLFVTPEYNRSVPGVLKNAIDVASRPPGPRSAGSALRYSPARRPPRSTRTARWPGRAAPREWRRRRPGSVG